MTWLAVGILLILISLQVTWLWKAVVLQWEERDQSLRRLAPELALAVNSIGHDRFHGDFQGLEDLPLGLVEGKLDSVLKAYRFEAPVAFALYVESEERGGIAGLRTNKLNQDGQSDVEGDTDWRDAPHRGALSEDRDQLLTARWQVRPQSQGQAASESKKRLLKGNAPAHTDVLLNSDIRACMSCIVSFSIAPKLDRQPGESDAAFSKRLSQEAQFQYFRPVRKAMGGADASLDAPDKPVLWLALHSPHSISQAIQSLIWLFLANLLFLLVLLFLFRYLLRSLARHKHISRVKEDFFNHMTHEFKTPLSSIRLASRVLRQSRDPVKNATYHDVIERESRMLEGQVDKLLLLSLLDNHGMALDRESLDLHALIREIPARMKMQLEEGKAELDFELLASQPHRKVDRNHLSNCLTNLVENSLKYAGSGVKVEIATQNIKDKLEIRIRDNGPGISEASREKIFERFFRDQAAKTEAGFGIGLSYVRQVIEAHGGSIRVNPDLRQGTEFIIELV